MDLDSDINTEIKDLQYYKQLFKFKTINTSNLENDLEQYQNYTQNTINEIPNQTELKYNNDTYVFVILRHLREPEDNDLWFASYNSIRKYYTNKIIIIDDNSKINAFDTNLYNTEIIKSEFAGAGEILPYYYFLKHKWADKMIFLHDSMFINRPFTEEELNNEVNIFWHFNKYSYLDINKLNDFINILSNNTQLLDFLNNESSIWYGCFGVSTIITFDVVKILEEKYNIFSKIVKHVKTKKDRECLERLMGIVLFFENLANKNNISMFGEIHNYPYAFFESNNIQMAFNIVNDSNYNTSIVKIWRGR